MSGEYGECRKCNRLVSFHDHECIDLEKPMTVEEMERRWPRCPPYKASRLDLSDDESAQIAFLINQDTIKEIRAYLDAVEECMNG